MQWGIHHHTTACKCQQERDSLTPCQGRYQSWRQCVTPPCVLMPLSRSNQHSWPAHWPGSPQYQTHCLQQIPYTSIWCTPWAHHLAARLPWHLTPKGKLILVHCRHPWSCHPGSTLKWETGSCEDELCHHGQATQHTSCTYFHYSSHSQACFSPWSSQVHQVHWWPDKGVPRLVQGHWQILWQIQDLTLSWCPSHDTCPQEIPPCLMSEGQRAPQQDGMPRHDHLCRWTNRLGILHYLCPEGKWQAMSVLGPLWPQWCHLLQSSEDAHCGGSCSQVCALPLLHQVGCPQWILVNHPWPGLQLAHDFQQSFQKILSFPATSLWPGLFPGHLPEENGSDPWRMSRMYWNHSQMTSLSMAAPRQNMTPTYEMVFNPQKTYVKAQAINFFGCLYDANGVHPDPGKVNTVHTLPAPTNVTKLQEFLGLVTYLSPFIPGLSTLTTHLQELLKKGTDFIWNCTHNTTFQWVKEAVISDTTLRYFDPSLPVTIQVDASQVVLGAALLQNGKPIALPSRPSLKLNADIQI